MKIDPDLVQQTLGIVGVCISEAYRTPADFAAALERVAFEARKRHADLLAESGIITQTSENQNPPIG